MFAGPVGAWMSKGNSHRDAWRPTRGAAGRQDCTCFDTSDAIVAQTVASELVELPGATRSLLAVLDAQG